VWAKDFARTAKGEEIHADLVPLLHLFVEERPDHARDLTEYDDFKVRAMLYQAGRLWQIMTALLQGLRLEVARALGWASSPQQFEDIDLGFRLMLGNLLGYGTLTGPPYAAAAAPRVDPDGLSREIDKWRAVAEAYPGMATDQGSAQALASQHRTLFLENYELSMQALIHVLNDVGLEIAHELQQAARPGRSPSLPEPEEHLHFVNFPRASRSPA
jgi:hypothetical protein